MQDDLRKALGVRGAPVLASVRRWPRAIPQYELGHGRFVTLAQEMERELPGLRFAGSWLTGAGVADCVALGEKVAGELV